jgi:periplasmic divalent cation tolerance protein
MEKALLVYTTFPDMGEAERLGRELVAGKLAACVNLIPGMHAVYAWKGAVETGQEVVGIIKTRQGLGEEVRAFLRAKHPLRDADCAVPAGGGRRSPDPGMAHRRDRRILKIPKMPTARLSARRRASQKQLVREQS